MTDIILFVIGIILLLGLGYLIFRLRRLEQAHSANPVAEYLSKGMEGMRESIDRTQSAVSERLSEATKIISAFTRELGAMQELGHSIKDFQLLLRSPKLRGEFSEQMLYELLEAHVPREHFEKQYRFSDGEIVDCVLKMKGTLIPIDAKYSLENFRAMHAAEGPEREARRKDFLRDTKRHIESISRKYIRPGEGTVEFAVMYVQAEPAFQELVNDPEGIGGYAHEKRVLLTSPNTLHHFITVFLTALQRERFHEGAMKVLGALQAIEAESRKLGDVVRVMQKHTADSSGAMDRLSLQYEKLHGKVEQAKALGGDEEKIVLEEAPEERAGAKTFPWGEA
ncbi:DNA recombination protein RmuC [Candidatus Azambacteria bacterium]|nr:DNA recombination protein RmuC [Candidatus Azambacteria bacterium]